MYTCFVRNKQFILLIFYKCTVIKTFIIFDMNPLIGISANYDENNSKLAENYYKSIIAAGGTPVIIPVTDCNDTLEKIVASLDGILFSGGGDMHPCYYGEEPIPENGEVNELRDRYDYNLMITAAKWQLPILGICRGMQTINIAFGGSLYQDIKAQYEMIPLNHSQEEAKSVATQKATIAEGSLLNEILGVGTLDINTIHHQSVNRVAEGFRAVAHTDDGICEAVESLYYPIVGVQWHPEHLSGVYDLAVYSSTEITDNPHLRLFRWLVNEAKLFSHAKKIHANCFVVDSHCDTPMFFHYDSVNVVENKPQWVDPADFDAADEKPLWYEIKVDAKRMQQGRVDAVFMVAYIPQNTPNDEAVLKAKSLLNKIVYQVDKSNDKVRIARSFTDIQRAKVDSVPAIILGIENGYALGNSLDNIDYFYTIGVRYITLCHNGDNPICDSAMQTNRTHNGLSVYGRQVVSKMNELGIMVDISHAGEKSFWDIIEHSSKPIIASHSCCKSLRNHPRNLTDEQIKAIAQKGGVVQICLYKHFLSDTQKASVADVIRHIKHIINLVGIDYVGIGSDFDGGGEIMGCRAENEIINITKALIREGFSDEDIYKVLGGNLLRVFREQA